MNMKRKIRRAFKNATPQVLHRISSAPTKVIAMPDFTEKPEQKVKKKMKLQELVAVAAAMVLIIGSLASGIQFIGQHIQSGGIGVIPTEPDLIVDELSQTLTQLAKQCIAPEDVDNVTFITAKSSTNNPVYRITVKYEGYLYELSFNKQCELLALEATATLDKASRITESAAIHLAYLLHQTKGGEMGPNTVQSVGDLYAVTFLDSNGQNHTYYVTATTGKYVQDVLIGELEHSEGLVNTIWGKILARDGGMIVPEAYRQQNTSIVDLGIVTDRSMYRIEIRHKGYLYRYEVDRLGNYHSIYLVENDEPKEGYIAPDVVMDIISLNYDIELADGISANILLEDGQYRVTIYGSSKASYLVDATTGEVLANMDVTQHLDAALTYYGLSVKDCWHITMELVDEGLPSAFVRFNLHCGTGVYVASVQLSSGAIVDNYILMTELPEFIANPPAVDWQTARDIALQNCNLSLSQLTGLRIYYHPDLQVYEFYFGIFPEEHACCVDAITGQMTTLQPVTDDGYIGESAAMDVLVLQLPEDVRTAFLAAADISTSCSLVETDELSPYYHLCVCHKNICYEAKVDALTGQLLDYQVTEPEVEPTPPDGKIDQNYAIRQAIDALVDEKEVKVFVRACSYVESDEGDYYLVDYFAGGCYYRVAIGAYGAGRLWHEGYDFEDTLNGFSEIFSTLGSWENMALTHTYESSEQLHLAIFFYNGVGEEFTLTADELDQLRSYGYSEEYDIQRMSAVKMEEVLSAYFGCQIEDTNTYGLVYLESTDCYYLWNNDLLVAERFYAFGLIQDGDVYHMYYILQDDGQPHKLTFQVTADDQIVIHSNLAVDLIE